MTRSYSRDWSFHLRHGRYWSKRCRKCVHFDINSYYKCVLHLWTPCISEIRRYCKDFSREIQLTLFD